MKPCDLPPALPCCHAGRCYGRVMWEGKTPASGPPGVAMEQVQACKWSERATAARMKLARENEIDAGESRRNHNPAA